MRTTTLLVATCALFGAVACSSTDDKSGGEGPSGAVAVTADWLDHRLTLFDFDRLVKGGAGRADVVLGEVDLHAFEQGPLEVAILPGGKTAIVSASPGFFALAGAEALVKAPPVSTAPSRQLFVNLETRTVEADLDVGAGPSGIAVTPDGKRALVAHAGSNDLTILDVASRSVAQQVDVGGNFTEQVAIDDSGTAGIVTRLTPGKASKSAVTFAVADVAGTLSPPLELERDAAGVPFFPGTKVAFAVLAYNPLGSATSGYALIDASNPSAPVLLEKVYFDDARYVVFQAVPAPARGTVLLPITQAGVLKLREYAFTGGKAVLQDTFDVANTSTFGAFGIVVDAANRVVMTLPADKSLAVLDLNTRSAFVVPWTDQPGPMGIALY